MKPETAAFIQKSREFLVKAQDLLNSLDWPDEAGRAAYLAGFHAAQALLFEKTDRVFKTHKGVRAEFLRLTRNDPRIDKELRAFLGSAYNLKAIADYETGPGSRVSEHSARAVIEKARWFVERVTRVMAADAPSSPGVGPKA